MTLKRILNRTFAIMIVASMGLALLAGPGATRAAAQQEGFIGEIRLFAGNFAPRSWAFCDGQLLPISQNTALFSILGTTYGGDGRTTFGLPDLRGRVPLGARTGPGLTNRVLGSRGGTQTETLTVAQIPSHTHSATAHAYNTEGNQSTPTNNFPAKSGSGDPDYDNGTANTTLNSGAVTIGNTGGGSVHNNMQPFLTLNYIICTSGIFPSRN